tara:strand:- start:313 stop:429 length:117 start_codon:yes stop_codon:yes gene_type:complete
MNISFEPVLVLSLFIASLVADWLVIKGVLPNPFEGDEQ